MTESSSVGQITLKKPDKVVAGVFLTAILLVGAGALWGLYLLLPLLVELAKDTIMLGVEVFVLLAFGLGLTQLWMARESVIMKFKMNAQNVRRRIIADNPIGAIDIAIKTFDQKLTEIDTEQISADAALTRLKNRIRNREKSGMLDMMEKEDALATAAEKMGRSQSEIAQHATACERWKKAAETVQPMVDDQVFIKGQLMKARDIAGSALEDMKNQRVVLSAQYEAYQESQAQAKAFRRFFGANPELDTINFAVESIEKQTTEAQASIDQLMHQLAPRIASQQLQREAEAAEAMRRRAEAKQLTEKLNLPLANTTAAQKELKS